MRVSSGPPASAVSIVLAAALLVDVAPQSLERATFATAMVTIPAGRFTMGSPPDEPGRNSDEIQHEVIIPRPLLLGAHEVTQEEWRSVMGTRPSHFGGCAKCPVERVNYFEIEEFLTRVNDSPAELRYRLPTEAEWEYACRAGMRTPFATGENLTTAQANYNGRFPFARFAPGVYRQRTTPVATFPPNGWGLYDMHGNVWEWTSDWYDDYPVGPVSDPQGPADGRKRVIRGGSWYFDANSTRCALRYTHAPQDRGFSLGFRLAAGIRGR